MEHKIQTWGRLAQPVPTVNKDLGGVLSGIGSGAMSSAALITGPAAPFVMAGGAVLGLVGSILSGKKKQKEEEAALRVQQTAAKQAQMLTAPHSGGGLKAPNIMAEYGGYLTPKLLAKKGIQIPESKKRVAVKPFAKENGGFVNPLNSDLTNLVSYKGGGTHAQNPLGGIPLGKAPGNETYTVEDGETSFKLKGPDGQLTKYVYSKKLIFV